MSGASNARGSATASAVHDRRITRSRVTSTRMADGDRPASSRNRGEGFAAQRPERIEEFVGVSLPAPKKTGRNLHERQLSRTTVTTTTTEKFHVRTKSPITKEFDGGIRKTSESRHSKSGSGLRREKEKEFTPKPIWDPMAEILPHTTAPLAGRITAVPLASQAPSALQPRTLKELPMEDQEKAILGDLLFVFMGFEGQYIRFQESYDPSEEKSRLAGPSFRILSGLDPSLRDLTVLMLKMATHYSAVEAFIEVQSREEFGAVNHALCAAMRRMLREYLVLIAQLEEQVLKNSEFTLHRMHLHTMSMNHTLMQLYAVAQELLKKNSLLEEDLDDSMDDLYDVDNILERLREGGDLAPGNMSQKKICKGGNVLGVLVQRLATLSGDPDSRTLLETLLREASRPYMSMLNEWLHHGGIKDPHAEFLIKEQKSIKRERLEEDYTDEYWEKRYTIRESEVPPQLVSLKDKVLLAGKYLNVVRECGGVDTSKEVRDAPETIDDPRFIENVNNAYAHANESLLELLINTHGLPARFRSLKHYFFLDHSDFFSYFLDLSASELKKPAVNVNTGKLQSLLDIVLRQPGSIAAQDPFKEDVKIKMNETSLTKSLMRVVNVRGIDQETVEKGLDYQPSNSQNEGDEKPIIGFDALEFDYSVPFPLSLVISRKTIARYQFLFRYILSLRHLESLLVNCWSDHSKIACWTNKSSDRRIETWKRKTWTLRARMLEFVQQLLYFCTAEVIEPNWQNLMARVNGDKTREGSMKTIRTVDELMQDHVDFLDTCLKECMLTQSRLLRIHSKLTNTCYHFATYTAVLTRQLFTADPTLPGTASAIAYFNAQSTTRHPIPESARLYDPTKLAYLESTLDKFEANFARHLRILLDVLNYYAATETVVLLGLCARLQSAGEGMEGMGSGSVLQG